jgi:hypothetical protein
MISVLGQFRNGLRVRGTIRSLKDESKVTTMRALLPRIELVEADRTGGAVRGTEHLMRVRHWCPGDASASIC